MFYGLNKEISVNTTGCGNNQSLYLLMDDITAESCKEAIDWILANNFSEEKPDVLTMMICSSGGCVNSAFALIDIMRGSSIPVRTIGLGEIASSALMIFMAGEAGQRVLTPNTSILSHQFSSGSHGKHHELISTVRQFNITQEKMVNHYIRFTGLDRATVISKLLPSADVWLTAEEALELNVCDVIKDLA